jgi:lipopolysaccharide transport system permease protein
VIIAVQLLFTLALTYIISALNVLFRDLQHIVANLLTLWFFATPVVYMASKVTGSFRLFTVTLNPMAILVMDYQSILYDHQLPDPLPLMGLAAFSVVLMWLAATLFESRREEFAELI